MHGETVKLHFTLHLIHEALCIFEPRINIRVDLSTLFEKQEAEKNILIEDGDRQAGWERTGEEGRKGD